MSKATEIAQAFNYNQEAHFNAAGEHIVDVCKASSGNVLHNSPYGQGSVLYTFADASKIRTWPSGFGFKRAWQVE